MTEVSREIPSPSKPYKVKHLPVSMEAHHVTVETLPPVQTSVDGVITPKLGDWIVRDDGRKDPNAFEIHVILDERFRELFEVPDGE